MKAPLLSISAISGADYYLGGAGGACCTRQVSGPADYELGAVAGGEPPGQWAWRGENALGQTGAIHATGPSGEAFREVVDHLHHPVTGRQLGRAPQNFRSAEARVAAYQRRHPEATPEELAEVRMQAAVGQKSAVNAWDATFSPPKSWSVLHAALTWAGRTEEAEALWEALETGVNAALTELYEELAFIQSKPTGPEVAGRRTARYERAANLQMATFRHHRSREGDPQMHVHTMIVNRLLDQQGRWRALYSPAMLRAKAGLDGVFLRTAEAEATRRLGLTFATTEDGVSREIVGVSPVVRTFFSSRSRALTEEAQQEVDRFGAEHGRAPSQRERWLILQHANKATRRAKSANPPPLAEQAERWEEAARETTRESFAELLDAVDAARVEPGAEVTVPAIDAEVVIEAALADLDQAKSVFSRSHLAAAIARRLPDMIAAEPADTPMLLRELTERATRHPRVVCTEAPAAVPSPRSLLDVRSGRSMFDAPDGRKFTTRSTLEREGSLAARLDARGAPSVSPQRAAVLLEASGLSEEQDAAVRGALTSGRRLEVVDAAAGTGKSTMARALSQAAEDEWGVGVVGFTVAENAAQVLRRQGLGRAHNIAAFRTFLEREQLGEVSDAERVEFAVPVGSYVVVDEASTVDTPTLVALLDALDRLGVGKVLLVGDRRQADPVDAGGGFAMLVDEVDARARQAAREAQENARAQAERDARDGSDGVHVDLVDEHREPRALPPSPIVDAGAAEMAAWTTPREREAQPASGGRRRAVSSSVPASAAGPTVHRLREVHRFDQRWERDASVGLREGDVTALHQYATRARLHGHSDRATVRDQAVAGFVADWLSGRDSIIVTATTEAASEAADHARAQLAAAGHVEREGVRLRDNTHAGVGDLIQTRENDRRVGVVNRQRWQVVGRDDVGRLQVREALGPGLDGERRWGPVHPLPADYVAEQVELAYAGTVHAVEGTTVHGTSHTIVSRSMGRSHAYVGLTRATEANHAYLELEPSPALERARAQVTALEHRVAEAGTEQARESAGHALADAQARLDEASRDAETPVQRLAAVLGTDDHVPAARTAVAAEEDRATHLGHLGPQWEFLVRETRAAAHRDMLRAAFGDEADAVLADPGSTRLFGLIRGAELSGHEPAEALQACADRGTLTGARRPASVVYARLADEMATGPLARPVPIGFEARTPRPSLGDEQNEKLAHAAELGRVMDRRAARLGELAALDGEPWAVRVAGPVPDDPDERARWIGRVSLAAAYRERYAIDDEHTALGRRPPHAEPERGWLWDTAAKLIGVPEHERDLAAVVDGELHNRVQQWERALAWMPRNVDEDLATAHAAWREAEQQVTRARAQGLDPGDWQADAEDMAGWTAKLEEIAAVRAEAYEATAGVRERAHEARDELERREDVENARQGLPHRDDPGAAEPDEDELAEYGDLEVGADERDLPAPEQQDEPAPREVDPGVLRAVFDHLAGFRSEEEPPAFGTWEWAELPDDDPAKRASVEAAAAAWWRVGEPMTPDEIDRAQGRLAVAREALGEPGPGPEADVLEAVMSYVGPHLSRDDAAPEYGTTAWAEADDDGRHASAAAAALREWNLGEPLTGLEHRADQAEDVATSHDIAKAVHGEAERFDHRAHAEVERDRAERETELAQEAGDDEWTTSAGDRAASAREQAEQARQAVLADTEAAWDELGDDEGSATIDRSRYADTLAAAREAEEPAQHEQESVGAAVEVDLDETAPEPVAEDSPEPERVAEDIEPDAVEVEPEEDEQLDEPVEPTVPEQRRVVVEADPEPVTAPESDPAEQRRLEREARDAEIAEQQEKAREVAAVLEMQRAREVEEEQVRLDEELQRSREVEVEQEAGLDDLDYEVAEL